MTTIQEKTIDLNNINPEDLFIRNTEGGTLYVQVEGDASITFAGKSLELDTYVNLPVVDMGTFTKSDAITGEGFYMCIFGGLDQIQMTASGTGRMHWKVMGE